MFVASLGIPSLLFSVRESAGLLHSLSHCWPELQEALATLQLWGLFRLK